MENRGNQKHVGIFGAPNAGKSTLFNQLLDQDYSIVSEKAGTTTDPVYKAMEVPGLGPCLFIDTAGLYDDTSLSEARTKRSRQVLEECDLCLLLARDGDLDQDLLDLMKEKKKRVFLVENGPMDSLKKESLPYPVLPFKKEVILKAIAQDLAETEEPGLLDGLVQEKDQVVLVMPQDIQAPKGRLILPQVMTIRDLLDKSCLIHACKPETLASSLEALKEKPDLIITDSQAFSQVWDLVKDKDIRLTSFSILLARYKGDIQAFFKGAQILDSLNEESRILMAEACTHAPMEEDIGRVKIPRLLKKYLGEKLRIDFSRGLDFPEDLSSYDLVISCGACMFNRRQVLSRLYQAEDQGVPMTNYGLVLAKYQGILDKVVY